MEIDKEKKPFIRRLWGLGVVVFLVFAILGFNLWRLQIAEASYYESKAQGNIMKLVSIPANRGDILDRNGELLVTSIPEFTLTIDWMELQNAQGKNWKETIFKLAEYIEPFWPIKGQSVEYIAEDILVMMQNQQWERYRPISVLNDVSDELKAIIAEHKNELPGVDVVALPVRDYPMGNLAGHIIGYVREVSSEEEIAQFNANPMAQEDGFTYSQGDMVGKMGVEKSYDYWLRGVEGTQMVIVDNNARPISKEVIEPAQPGKTLQLTIDKELQEVMQNSLDKVFEEVQKEYPHANMGAAVAIEVKTGRILAMASRPYMDPNDLTGIISEETSYRYFQADDAASFDRAISGTYPPGSTYKMFTAMAGLHAGVVTPYEKFNSSNPAAVLGTRHGIQEWNGYGFGLVDLNRAMARSSNTYFQAVAQRVFNKNPELLKQISNEFGLGVYTGIDIPGEAKGHAPSPEWKKATFGPIHERARDKGIAEIEKKYEKLFAEAADEDTRKKLERQKQNEIKQVEAEYAYNVRWYVDWQYFETFNTSIGQGDNLYTPLQLANAVATIVNGGKRMQPYVVDKILDPVTGEVVFENKPIVRNTVSVSPEILDIIKESMSKVTSGEGTASLLFADVPEFTGGAKTGTAQIGSRTSESTYNGVFVAFAPYDDPQIAFAGVVEEGGHGGSTAGRVAKDVFVHYFGWNKND